MTVHAGIPTGELDGLQGARPPSYPQPCSAHPVSLPHPYPLLEEFGPHSNDLDPELDSICANLPPLTVPSRPPGWDGAQNKADDEDCLDFPSIVSPPPGVETEATPPKKTKSKTPKRVWGEGWCNDFAILLS